jgi:HEAT repeat protein
VNHRIHSVTTERSGRSNALAIRKRVVRRGIQLGVPERTFPDETLNVLLPMLRSDEQPEVLYSVACAVGHLHDVRAVPALSALATHSSDEVRFGIVMGLLGEDDATAIATLIALSEDEDADVRDWATFGLGSQTDMDTPEIRGALALRLTDPDGDTRQEARLGLARRRDFRALPSLKTTIESGAVSSTDLEAAAELADSSLLPALKALEPVLGDDADLRRAIAACSGAQ